MKLKPILSAASLVMLSTLAGAAAGDVETLTWKKDATTNLQTGVLNLAAGESVKALWGGVNRSATASYTTSLLGVRLRVTKDSESTDTDLIQFLSAGSVSYGVTPFQIAGPAVIRLTPGTDTGILSIMATFEVTRPAAPSVTPSNAAVIPVDASGTFTVILESSTDLITWTAANPGDYSGNTVKRFFRTRIVKK